MLGLVAHHRAPHAAHKRGLKVTLFPFVMMDIAAGNTLTDPYSGAGAQPLYPWRGRITCDPAPGVGGTSDGSAAAAAGPTARWHHADVRVKIYGGALASASDLAVLAGANAAALRNADGDWEVIQFAEAKLIGDRTYRLTKLLRGQAGSEWAMAPLLAAGASFVLLDGHAVTIASGSGARDRAMALRVVAAGRDTADATALALDVTPGDTALKPLAPVHLRARRDGAGVTLRWIRRTRADGDSWSGEVPLGEDSERYEIDILSGATVLRTLTSATPSVLYAAADELADFGAAQSSLTVRVAQVSATAGRGFAAAATLRI